MALIIVESPTKARTFNRIFKIQKNDKYFVFATMGHIRDLPAKEISVDYEHEFKPKYEIVKSKQKIVTKLRELAKEHKEIILATDPDREGESISYHAAYLLGLVREKWPEIKLEEGQEIKRIVFHEITPSALQHALENPEKLRLPLVQAQQARRILDRIVGYELSPLLWKKMGKNWLSAGRVQTVALRLVVEREKEITVFDKQTYFQIFGDFKDGQEVRAKLVSRDNVPYEKKHKIQLFAGEYEYVSTSIFAENVQQIADDAGKDEYEVGERNETLTKKYPPPPFTTSLLQQDAFFKFGYSSKQTMRLAQDLYERGLISYHRTDSFNLSTQFVFRAKDYIVATYGEKYGLEKPRGYRTKSRMAQEAHEAIRPTKLDNTVEKIFAMEKLTQNHKRIYKLIFDRAVSTQMKEAEMKNITIRIMGKKGYVFEAEFHQVLFDGFLKVLNPDFVERNKSEPQIKQGEKLVLLKIDKEEKVTTPPPRYNEATLVRTLEEKGIGRPSTYASIIGLIQDKYYIEKKSRYFYPTHLGRAISDYLSAAFSQLFDLGFTAQMEDQLDKVAENEESVVELLNTFYVPFKKELIERKLDTTPIDVEDDIKEKCPKCEGNLVVRFSKFGRFLACGNYPKCKFTKPFLDPIPNKKCPECGGGIVVRYSKNKKRFYGCANYPTCKYSAWTLKDVVTVVPEETKPAETKKEV